MCRNNAQLCAYFCSVKLIYKLSTLIIMATVSSSDILCATASFRGRQLAQFTSSGFNSFAEVLRAIRCAVGSVAGLIELSVLNTSRGWRECRSMYIAPSAPGVQLTLF